MAALQGFHLNDKIIQGWVRFAEIAHVPRRVHHWRPSPGQERIGAPGFEQHCTATLVVGINGTTCVEGVASLVLAPGDVLVIGAGTWHRHLPLAHDGACFRQGFILGRSDFHIVVGPQVLVGSVEREPSWSLVQQALTATDLIQQHEVLARLFAHVIGHGVEPLAAAHPAIFAMEFALWETLHLHLGVERIIAASGLHRSQAYRLAHQHWGMGISQRRAQARMELATELLRGGISVSETAFRCGFSNRRSFSHAFVRFHGFPPLDPFTGGR